MCGDDRQCDGVFYVQETQTQVEEEQRARDEARESYNLAERRCNALTAELEEMRVALEQVPKKLFFFFAFLNRNV